MERSFKRALCTLVPLCALLYTSDGAFVLAQEGVTYGPQTCMYVEVNGQRMTCAQYYQRRLQQQRSNAAAAAAEAAAAQERWRKAQEAAAAARQAAINAQERAYQEAKIRAAQEAAAQAAKAAQAAYDAFISDRDTYAARLRDVAATDAEAVRLLRGTAAALNSPDALRLSTQDVFSSSGAPANTGTLRVPTQESFSRNGLRLFDTGINSTNPAVMMVKRDFGHSAAAEALCAQSIAQNIQGRSAQAMHFLADQALQALNGNEIGIACDYSQAGKLVLKKAPKAPAAIANFRRALVNLSVAAAQQGRAQAAAATPTPSPMATAEDGLRTIIREQKRNQTQQRAHALEVFKVQKANEKKLDDLLLKAEAALKAAQAAEKKGETP